MNASRPNGVNTRKLFASWLSYMKSDASAEGGQVRLIEAPSRLPVSAIEQRLARALRESGPVSLARLVRTIAEELYEAELRKGAAASDLGMFGSGLFTAEVVRGLQAGDGFLWKINR